MDNSKHEEGCAFVTAQNPLDVKQPKTRRWFELMGIKGNCPFCGVQLEFKNEETV